MSDFSDRPFVAGSLVGQRSFRIDSVGRLTGVTYRGVWRPDENTAECRKNVRDDDGFGGIWGTLTNSITMNYLYGGTVVKPAIESAEARKSRIEREKVELELLKADSSHIGTLRCECGFYGYFDEGSNPYHTKGDTIRGLIEAYGRLTVGTRGFRAEKAVIVALVLPGKKAAQGQVGQRIGMVRRNYPDIEFYNSHAEALAAHPLVAPPIPTPDQDADFWTRSVS